MKLIWTKNTTPLSKIIRWARNEPCSHFAIVFDDSLVFHSNLLGVHLEWYNTFKKHNTIVHILHFDISLEQEEIIYRSIVDKYDGKSYDFKALLFCTWRTLLLKIFNVPFPTINHWQNPDAILCTGLAKAVLDIEGDVEIVSPETLWLKLSTTLPKKLL